jgi:hypothetical protein
VGVKGRRWAYVASGIKGVSIVDVDDPASPLLVDRFEPGGVVTRVAVAGDRLYVASTAPKRVQIYQIADEQSPVYLGELTPNGQVEALAVNGTTLHASEYTLSGWASILEWVSCLGGLHCRRGDVVEAFDVSDPAAAALVGTYDAGASPAAHWKPYRQYGLVRTSTGFDVYRVVPVP